MVPVRIAESEFIERRRMALAGLKDHMGIMVEVIPELADGSPGLDVFQHNEYRTIQMIRTGDLEPLGRRAARDQVDLDDFPQALIDRFRASDMVYAIPCEMRTTALLFRRDLLERYGVEIPTTWDDLAKAARSIQRSLGSDGIGDVSGFAGAGLAGFSENFLFLGECLFPSWGWRWNRGAGQAPGIDDAATVEALAFFVELMRSAGQDNPEHTSRSDARRLFSEGKAAFVIDSPDAWNCARMGGIGDQDSEIGMAMIPTGPTARPEPGLTATMLSIRGSSTVLEEAWEVIKVLVSPESLREDVIDFGFLESVRESVHASLEFVGRHDAGVRKLVRESRALARINRPMIEYGDDFGDIAGAAAEAAIAGLQTPGETLRVAQAMLDGMTWRT